MAYARKQKEGPESDQAKPATDDVVERRESSPFVEGAAESSAIASGETSAIIAPVEASAHAPVESSATVMTAASDADTKPVAKLEPAPPPPVDEPAPSAGVQPAKSIVDDRPLRSRTSTIAMPPQISVGLPPEIDDSPPAVSTPSISLHGVEDPTHMPGPREIPPGAPDDPAAPPGAVPPGDSRSMRKRTEVYEFALIYRRGTFVITRCGMVGTRGQWRVVEYPTQAAAAHAYAKECSRFVSEGFSDYRA